VIAACRITDPAGDGRKNENFTVEMFVNSFASDPETFKKLGELQQHMQKLREKVKPARDKLAAHADRDAVHKGKPLGEASFQEWDDFWSALQEFVRILNEKLTGKPFEIDAGGVMGDAESLLKALSQSQHFETLLNGDDPAISEACLKLPLPAA
jgi:AbiU2